MSLLQSPNPPSATPRRRVPAAKPVVRPNSLPSIYRTHRAPFCGRIFLVASVLYIFASMQGTVKFVIWPSVQEFLGQLDPYLYFQKTWDEILLSPWGIRTGVAMPSLLLAEFTSLTQPQTFGLQCGLCMAITALIINRTAVICFHTRLHQHELVVTGFIFLLGCFMNGRLCSAFVGSALLMRAHLYWSQGRMTTRRVMLHNFLALPLLTVSSGTFMVGFATIFLWLVVGLCSFRGDQPGVRLRLSAFPGMLPILYLASVQLFTFTDKLHDYYDGDMVQVLYHGYGQVLEEHLPGLTGFDVFLLGLFSMPFAGIAWSLFLRDKSRQHVYITLSVMLTLMMGACGYSTMLTNTPTIVLGGLAFAIQRRGKDSRPRRSASVPW